MTLGGGALFRIRRERDVHARPRRQETELRWKHTHDEPGDAVDANAPADRAGLAAEPLTPESIGQDRDAVRPVRRLFFRECAANRGTEADCRKEVRGDAGDLFALDRTGVA